MTGVRLLASRSELGYVDSSFRALAGEPEAVDEDEQLRQTRRAHHTADQRRRDVWRNSKVVLEREIDTLRGAFGTEVSDELRGLRRCLDRLERAVVGH